MTKHLRLLAPFFGICLFLLLYLIAAWLYPGGSRADIQARSFSLIHNYWCDLFDKTTYNGTVNPARPIAITAMVIASISLALLYFLLPRLFGARNIRHTIIQITGPASMLIAFFIFTRFHEEVINLGGLFGGIALLLTFIELYQSRLTRLYATGLLCIALSGLNFLIYKTGALMPLLAGIQKITFLLFCIWGCMLNWALYRKAVLPDASKI